METIAFLIEGGLLLIGAATWATFRIRNDRLSLRARVLVSLVDGKAIRGVLWARKGRLLVLRDATLIETGAAPVDMDGDVLVDRDRVEFVQAAGGF
jgi:small nuclear ribonucleoprotein (snRNP)-like protein